MEPAWPRPLAVALLGLALSGVAGAACARAEPPGPELGGASPSIATLPAVANVLVTPPASGGVALDAAVPPTMAAGLSDAEPPPSLDDPGALPQTRVRPPAESPALEARVKALWEAIVRDEPERAAPFFFPVKAYEQVKAIPRPESDWKHRLFAAFARDIHAAHRRLGAQTDTAKFLRFEIPAGGGRWVEPDEETNKIGYFRVYGARLHYEVDGTPRALDVKSLISWRGEWYVVHLAGFK